MGSIPGLRHRRAVRDRIDHGGSRGGPSTTRPPARRAQRVVISRTIDASAAGSRLAMWRPCLLAAPCSSPRSSPAPPRSSCCAARMRANAARCWGARSSWHRATSTRPRRPSPSETSHRVRRPRPWVEPGRVGRQRASELLTVSGVIVPRGQALLRQQAIVRSGARRQGFFLREAILSAIATSCVVVAVEGARGLRHALRHVGECEPFVRTHY